MVFSDWAREKELARNHKLKLLISDIFNYLNTSTDKIDNKSCDGKTESIEAKKASHKKP